MDIEIGGHVLFGDVICKQRFGVVLDASEETKCRWSRQVDDCRIQDSHSMLNGHDDVK